ncbi:MAG: hypothetical protein LBK61_06595 [Spirochaetaceae bacterium]|jgi:hypothetical protein|nr:hypothetical protein [Spirochaetaceae bacterium]
MKAEIKVFKEDGSHLYAANIDTADYRQVMNEIRKGRNAIGNPNSSTVCLECIGKAFRVGNEKDTAEWLKKYIKRSKA